MRKSTMCGGTGSAVTLRVCSPLTSGAAADAVHGIDVGEVELALVRGSGSEQDLRLEVGIRRCGRWPTWRMVVLVAEKRTATSLRCGARPRAGRRSPRRAFTRKSRSRRQHRGRIHGPYATPFGHGRQFERHDARAWCRRGRRSD